MKLTFAFYQYPHALHEILEWEKSQINNIIEKSFNQEYQEYVFSLKNEIVICLPINNYKSIIGLNTKIIFRYTNIYKYYKTLVFGKIDCKILNKLIKIQEYLEK